MKKRLKNGLNEAVCAKGISNIVIEKPKDLSFGHYATPLAFSLAKEYKKPPKLIAQELCASLEGMEMFSQVESVNGYINFRLSDDFIDACVNEALEAGEKFASATNKEKILLEFVSANPTGPLHIGHARGAILGDCLYRIGKHLGYDIKGEYYVNDAGSQIEMLGLSVYQSVQINILKNNIERSDDCYKGGYIDDLAKVAYEKFGKDLWQDKSACIKKISNWAKDEMLNLIKNNLASLHVDIEKYVSENAMRGKWNESFELLEKSGKVYEKEDKKWLESTALNDEKDRVIVREDGRPTYLAGDIIYHHDKYKRGFDKYINIWGADHHGYIARVKASINFLGYDEKNLEVILAQMVSLLKGGEPYKMSKRSGNFILMSDVVNEIGADALRFVFLSKKADTHLEFDVDMFRNNDSSNPIFYINYAYARINQLMQKSTCSANEIKNARLQGLGENAINLAYSALLLSEVLEDTFANRQVQKVTEYLKTLASSTHKLYGETKIIGSEHEKELLKVLTMVRLSLKIGLGLIGITAKEKM